MEKVSAAHRSRARRYAMQAIYQWQMTGNSLISVRQEIKEENEMKNVDVEYFEGVTSLVVKECSALDESFSPYLKGVTVGSLDPITHAILRLGACELKQRVDVPYRVVINEAIKLAKKYGAEDSHKFINGVLDQVAKDARSVEFATK